MSAASATSKQLGSIGHRHRRLPSSKPHLELRRAAVTTEREDDITQYLPKPSSVLERCSRYAWMLLSGFAASVVAMHIRLGL
jgi:hypothetical protein